MQTVVIKEENGKTALIIDGVQLTNILSFEIKKEAGEPLRLCFDGIIVSEVQIET